MESSAGSTSSRRTKEAKRRQRQEDVRRANEWAKRRAAQRAARAAEAAAASAEASAAGEGGWQKQSTCSRKSRPAADVTAKKSRREEIMEGRRRAEAWAARRKAERASRGGEKKDVAERDDTSDVDINELKSEEDRDTYYVASSEDSNEMDCETETKEQKMGSSSSRPSFFYRAVVCAILSAILCFGFPVVYQYKAVFKAQLDDIVNMSGPEIASSEPTDGVSSADDENGRDDAMSDL